MSGSIIERVANAIAARYAPAIDQRAPYAKIMMVEAAKAAIEAMREPASRMTDTTKAEVDTLAQIIRHAHVMTLRGRFVGDLKIPWGSLSDRERAPYVASAVAALRHFKGSILGSEPCS
jgi:hypothetical protein